MFAFALWDRGRRELFLARDHLGVKPLYYAWHDGALAFGSELKALRPFPGLPHALDLDALALYLECQYIPAPRTIYRAIRKLPAGHFLSLAEGKLSEGIYWRPSYVPKRDVAGAAAVDALDGELSRSVESMLVADVPLGAFVSGGVDSGVIAALATRLSGRALDTFNLGFTGTRRRQRARGSGARRAAHRQPPSLPDALAVRRAARARPLGRRVRRAVRRPGRAADDAARAIRAPRSDRRADRRRRRRGIRRLLELREAAARRAADAHARHARLARSRGSPAGCRRGSRATASSRPPPSRSRGVTRRSRTFSIRCCAANISRRRSPPPRARGSPTLAQAFYDDCDSPDYLDHLLNIDARLWLPDDLLAKVDRATMAFSLEARVPYLDHGFYGWCARLDPSLKVDGERTQGLLKSLAQRYLPTDIVHREKQGFMMPLTRWLGHELRADVENALGPDGLARRGLVRAEALDEARGRARVGPQESRDAPLGAADPRALARALRAGFRACNEIAFDRAYRELRAAGAARKSAS